MFIRWKTKRRTNRRGKEYTILEAALVENHRISGEVRQKYIKSLAVIREECLLYPIPRRIFLQKVSQKLESRGIERDERESILATFSRKIPELSPDDPMLDRSFPVRESLKVLTRNTHA